MTQCANWAPHAWLLSLSIAYLLSGPNAVQAQERFGERQNFQLTSSQSRTAFRDVCALSGKSTVKLLEKGKPIAFGVSVSGDGLIVTKASQALNADEIELPDLRRVPFQKLTVQQTNDLALLKIDNIQLPAVVWAEFAPTVGAWMVTVDTHGEPAAVGVMSVQRRKIPASDQYGVLGVELEQENLPRIRRVYPNSGAEHAGLTAGDVVVSIEQEQVATVQQLVRTLRKYRPGDTLMLQIKRKDENVSCNVTLTHPFGDFLSRIAFQNQMGGALSFRRDDFEGVYQSDAVIAPEQCGGPVVGLDGKVLGINIARAGRTDTYVLPADLVQSMVQQYQTGNTATLTTSTPALTAPAPMQK